MKKPGGQSLLQQTYFISESKLFLCVFQGVEAGGAAVPQSLHLRRVVLKGLAFPHHCLKLLLHSEQRLLNRHALQYSSYDRMQLLKLYSQTLQ